MRLIPVARAAALAVVCVALAGCSSNNKGKIEGTRWSSVAQSVKGNTVPAGAMTLEFKADGGFVMVAGPSTMTGKYSLGMGDHVTLNMDQALEGRKKHVETIRVTGDSLEMIDSDGTSVKFKKAS